jgi:hypothetical protein
MLELPTIPPQARHDDHDRADPAPAQRDDPAEGGRTMHRDRTGEPVDDDPADQHRCEAGWLGEDHLGRPIPCAVCRAETIRNRDRRRAVLA